MNQTHLKLHVEILNETILEFKRQKIITIIGNRKSLCFRLKLHAKKHTINNTA